MSERLPTGTTLRTTASLATTGLAAQAIRVIDVSEKPTQANVIRDGKQVPSVAVDATALKNFLDLGVVRPAESLTRVVAQGIPAGTRVPRGTSVDIVLAEPRIVPLGVLERPHRGLLDRGLTVQGVVDDFLADAEIRNAVLDAPGPEALPPATRERIRSAFAERDAPIDDGDPARDFGAAFRTLKAAAAFR